jgi:hypothetical protein
MRILTELPQVLTIRELEMIGALATYLREVWNSPSTNASENREVIRCLVERV